MSARCLPYFIPRWLAQALGRKETDYATIRLLSSVVAFPLCWGLETWLVWRSAGAGWAIAFAVSLPLSGLAAYHYLRGLDRLRAKTRFSILALTRGQAASRLLTERRAILAELEHAKADFLGTRDAAETPESRTSAGTTAAAATRPAPLGGPASGGTQRPPQTEGRPPQAEGRPIERRPEASRRTASGGTRRPEGPGPETSWRTE